MENAKTSGGDGSVVSHEFTATICPSCGGITGGGYVHECRPTADLGEELIAMIVKWEDSIETPDDLARKIIERVSRSGG